MKQNFFIITSPTPPSSLIITTTTTTVMAFPHQLMSNSFILFLVLYSFFFLPFLPFFHPFIFSLFLFPFFLSFRFVSFQFLSSPFHSSIVLYFPFYSLVFFSSLFLAFPFLSFSFSFPSPAFSFYHVFMNSIFINISLKHHYSIPVFSNSNIQDRTPLFLLPVSSSSTPKTIKFASSENRIPYRAFFFPLSGSRVVPLPLRLCFIGGVPSEPRWKEPQ